MGDFSTTFRALRQASKLTQDELARLLSISKSSISMYENGNREPDFETLEKIAGFFCVDMNYLLGHTSGKDGHAAPAEPEPAYDRVLTVYTRSKKNLSQEEKMRLARIILSDDEE